MEGSSSAALFTRRLEGKVAVITGGASGIGESTTRLYVKNGAKVVIADIQDELGLALCEEIGCKEAVSFVHCDVRKESDVQNAVDAAIAKYGKLDILFSNAGVTDTLPSILDVSYEEYKRIFDVNVYGAFNCAKHAARVMIPAKKGSIIFNTSVIAEIYGDGSHIYTASKKALLGLTQNLCVELGQHGIRVNCISPYGIATPTLTKAFGNVSKEKAEEWFCEAGNLKYAVSEAEDVAQSAVFLGSDESKYVSGLNLVVDGGYSKTNIALKEALRKQSAQSSIAQDPCQCKD